MKKLALQIFSVIFCCVSVNSFATTYYVSYSTGIDTYNGTALATPFKTITKAVSVAVAGDIIYLRGEEHLYTTRINISKSGTATSKFYLLAYPGDATRPVLNFSAMAINSSNRGFDLSGNYWVFKGFDIYKAGDNGMHVNGSYNIFEFCSFYENADTGLQFDNGASNNQVINCDSYYNIDPSEGNADGFAVKLNVGTNNSFRGCRAWQNSDDGWDGLLTAGFGQNPSTTYDSCWVFLNGYKKDMTASVGNGNGLKMGGSQEQHDVIVRNCLAVYNRSKGFDQNNNIGSMILYNCTGYKNGRNFGMANYDPAAGKEMTIKNSISYLGINGDQFRTVAVRTNNSWQSPFTVDNSDFVSLDTSVLRAPRNADGSLPNINFMKLAQGSDLIDGGTNVGLPYNGSAPDPGYKESNYVLPVELISFNGAVNGDHVDLSWQTATEIKNVGWDIERYVPGTNTWQKISFIPGNTNSTSIKHYSFRDKKVIGATNVLYRLKQIDEDGRIRYSNTIKIKYTGLNEAALKINPNPSGNYLNAEFYLDASSHIQLKIQNASGQLVKLVLDQQLEKGMHVKTLNTSAIPSGQYYLTLIADGIIQTQRFIKTLN
jgi:hypothetical protein